MDTTLEATSISERRACALVSLSRDSRRHPPQRAQHDQATSQRIIELAHEWRRFGYRRIGDLLRAAGANINDKRVYRLYKLAQLLRRMPWAKFAAQHRQTTGGAVPAPRQTQE